ncbi:MAG TPA: diphthine--ammonia ligase [Nanoarchaeota archaeon]|nr:diphthine--ammonia ligase [Nanoarchaeota archaeon]HIH34732.1 diphthine--ammonia ligase [Nanoarchaeota archaeon]HIH51335.1 diphthine--ammonia ligase [Nanoarchaeota archaeon]HIH66312.1 diphthine--ammonia ligase [Nanoarchaeota archaeon]
MKVGILYSGGKDSAYALGHALEKGWEVAYLLTVVPTRKDCYLFHYATTQHAAEVAKMLGIKHVRIECDIADSAQEAELVKDAVAKEEKVDALILGGVGLQETQIKSLQNALRPLKVEAFAAHAGHSHEELVWEMLEKGYKIIISQFASDGLKDWLGKEITKENFLLLIRDSQKYGFHIGFEGGYADTFCLDAPYFPKSILLEDVKKVYEDAYNGHVEIGKMTFIPKESVVEMKR